MYRQALTTAVFTLASGSAIVAASDVDAATVQLISNDAAVTNTTGGFQGIFPIGTTGDLVLTIDTSVADAVPDSGRGYYLDNVIFNFTSDVSPIQINGSGVDSVSDLQNDRDILVFFEPETLDITNPNVSMGITDFDLNFIGPNDILQTDSLIEALEGVNDGLYTSGRVIFDVFNNAGGSDGTVTYTLDLAQTSVVPGPSSLTLIGALGLGLMSRRRR